MAHIEISQHINASPDQVWTALADLASHSEWMRDARSIEFLTESRRGEGTRMEVETVVGPFRTTDIMEVVGWDEGRSIDVVHQGLVTGTGRLSISDVDGTTTLTWAETLTFPLWLGGGLTAWFARPVLRSIWKGNLRRFDQLVSSP
jgi:uncharacterized protein YndB with AHSA1/START domain